MDLFSNQSESPSNSKNKIIPFKRRNRFFTLEERILLEKYINEGRTHLSIARLLGRSTVTIWHETKRLGLIAYDAHLANEDAIRKNKLRRSNLVRSTKSTRSYVRQKLDALEMQIEILHDTIKGMLNDKKDK